MPDYRKAYVAIHQKEKSKANNKINEAKLLAEQGYCAWCYKLFTRKNIKSKFCSEKCQNRHDSRKYHDKNKTYNSDMKCEICGYAISSNYQQKHMQQHKYYNQGD